MEKVTEQCISRKCLICKSCQVIGILLTMDCTESQKVAITRFVIGIDSQVSLYVVSMKK